MEPDESRCVLNVFHGIAGLINLSIRPGFRNAGAMSGV